MAKIFVVRSDDHLDFQRFEDILESLRVAAEQDDVVRVRALLHDFKIEFNESVVGSNAKL